MISGGQRIYIGRPAVTLGRRGKASSAPTTAADLTRPSEVLGRSR